MLLGSSRLLSGGRPGTPPERAVPASAEAVAFGALIDSPRPAQVVEEGLRVAEKLRQRYGIDTGDAAADRQAAARRAQAEFLDRLTFPSAEVEEAARSLGYSLDPAACADYCDNVRRLAVADLMMQALRAFADGREGPGRPEPQAAGPAGR